jgi:hypothetical protein
MLYLTLLKCKSSAMPDHRSEILRPDGSIDLAKLMRVAHRAAAAECAAWQADGYTKPYRHALRQALRDVWSFVTTEREIRQIKQALAASPADRATTIRSEIAALAFRDDYRAATARCRELESELTV